MIDQSIEFFECVKQILMRFATKMNNLLTRFPTHAFIVRQKSQGTNFKCKIKQMQAKKNRKINIK